MTNFVPASIEEAQTWLQQRLEQPKPFQIRGNQTHFQAKAIPSSTESEDVLSPVSYTHLTLPTTPYV